jgi:hypothetical protein
VWSTIGALSQVTRLPVTTGVTCPTVRIHPAVIAQAAATSGVLHEGRFHPYRTGIQGMDLLPPPEPGYVDVIRRLQQALDPGDVIAPGRYDFRRHR